MEFPLISMFNGPEDVMCKIMYPIFGPQKSRQELTTGPGFANVNGPAVPGAQMEVFVLHWAEAVFFDEMENVRKRRSVMHVKLMCFITVVSKM